VSATIIKFPGATARRRRAESPRAATIARYNDPSLKDAHKRRVYAHLDAQLHKARVKRDE
jgi:hypothetical protein